jgi:autotransporter-associated beta strand protein
MARASCLSVALLAAAIFVPVPAHGQTWIGSTSDWNTASNWSPATVPNSPTAVVSFGFTTGSTAPNITASVQAQSVSFSSGSYTLSSSATPALSGLTTITIAAGVTGVETINLASAATGSLLFASTGPLTIADNSTSAATTLVIGPNTVIGTSGSGGVIVTGVGNVQIKGSFATSPNAVSGGISKSGLGKLILSGDGSNLTGGLTLNSGTLQLDYSTNFASKLGGGGLTLLGGTFSVSSNTVPTVTQTIPGGTTISQNHTDFVGSSTSSGPLTFALGTISRASGGSLDISITAGSPTFTTTTPNTNGLLGPGPAFATFSGGSTWATAPGGTIGGLSSYGTDTYASGVNSDVTTSAAPGAIATNSLRFNTGAPTLTLSGANTLQSGGILVTPSAAGGAITGGDVSVPGPGELIVHQYSATPFTVASNLVTSAGLTKTGPGTLVLSGTNTGLTGPINVSRGSLTVTNPAAVNSASQINFNDARGAVAQTLAVDLGNSATGVISAPIRLSAIPGAGNYGTFFSTGASAYSHVTFSGLISSAPGLTTPLYVADANNTNEIDLTNANTFTGSVFLGIGLIGINSDANLGNPSNVLNLQNGSTVSGGLLFLNSRINVARPITISGGNRFSSNGTDTNTISASISGNGTLVKEGTGTLVLTGGNNFFGPIVVDAGTLTLGTSGGLIGGSNPNNLTIAAGATFSPATAATFSNTFGAITLNGGAFNVPGGTGQQYTASQLVVNAPGGTVDFSAAGADKLVFNGSGSGLGININANSTWLGALNGSVIPGGTSLAPLKITVAPGVTFTNGLGLVSSGASTIFQLLGGGTLYQNSIASPGTSVTASIKVTNGRYRVTDVSSGGLVGNLGSGAFTLDGGTFAYGGASDGTSKQIALTANGGTIEIESAAVRLQANGSITGAGTLTKAGPGTLALANSNNSFTSLVVAAGAIEAPTDAVLGPGPITVGALGTLFYSASTTTSRDFNLVFGALGVSAGQTLTLNGGSVAGGFVVGPGTLALTAGSTVGGTTTASSLSISVAGSATFLRVTNGAALSLAAGLPAPINFSVFTNQGSGSVTIGAASAVNAADFQTYGTLTLNPAVVGSGQRTLLTNTGTSPMYFNGGSRTFIGTPTTATASPPVAGVDLHGQDLVVAGGLFVNNGFVADSTATPGSVIVDYGALYKGAGTNFVNVITQNGGKVQAGNSPGSMGFGRFVFGPGGVNNYVFAIDDATGTAGPSPDALGHVSGWGLVNAVKQQFAATTSSGDFLWTATPNSQLTIAIDTLVNPTTVGTDVAGPMDHFDPNSAYSWPAAHWAGSYFGPADAAALDGATSFDTGAFLNPVAGTFGWALDAPDHTLSLTYTPTAVPEPGTLALVGVAAIGWGTFRRRRASHAACPTPAAIVRRSRTVPPT